MGFDVENFGIGLLAGWASAYGIYRARHWIGSAARSASQRAADVQNYTVRSADSRYINDLIAMAEAHHLAGRLFKLSDILVEPRFIPMPPLAAPPEDEVLQNVFHVVPSVPDFPYLQAPYNIETLSIDDLGTGDHAVALLGHPGSGRTTALLSVALRSLGKIKFEQPVDKVQQRIDAEEAALNEKQRAVRIKERLMIEQRAKERLAEERGASFDADQDAQSKTAVPLFNRLMPVYVHLADVIAQEAEFGRDIDPAEPLVRAVQRQVGRVTASTLPRNLYLRLSRGQCLLLIDGYDDLPEAEKSRQLSWLTALMQVYADNFFIVTGPATGYGDLTRLGLTPVFLRPWTDLDSERAINRWAEAWAHVSRSTRTREARPLDEMAVQRTKTNNRGLSPFDLTLKVWANFAADADMAGFEGWLRAAIARHLPADQPFDAILPQLTQAAVLQLDEGYVTQARLEEKLTGKAVVPPQNIAVQSQNKQDSTAQEDDKESASDQGKLLAVLRKSGLLIRYSGGRYQFRHPFIAAYLASLLFKEMPEQIAAKVENPAWEMAIGYAALHTPIDSAVRTRLTAPVDVLQNNVLKIAHWLPYVGADAPWRAAYLKHLSGMLLTPSQYPLVRERAAAALITTRDKNVGQVFQQAARSSDSHLRRLACLGMGAAGAPEVIADLRQLLQDKNADVQLAAALALGAIRSDEAVNVLVEALTEGSEQLRRAVAETFADIPEEGYPVLYEAINDEEMMLRRAAVFGLRRIKSGWALIAVYRAFLEDEQWYVRSAAQMAFQEVQFGGGRGPKPYPPAEGLPWLNEWAATRGETVPPGEGANQMLLRALQEGEPSLRVYAAWNMGQLGLASMVKSLYGALRDRQPEVRDAAHRALAELQLQIGQPLPAPL